jgi:UDP-galactopyranose mutase
MDFGFEATVKMKPLESGDRYEYREWFNSYPLAHDGYNAFFDYALEGCTVQLGAKITDFGLREKRATLSSGSRLDYDLLISSTSPDVLLDFEAGRLEYVGRRFVKFVLPVEHAFPEDVYFCYYPSASAEMTRIVEYKKFTQHKSPNTLLVMEIPAPEPRLYPTLKKAQVKLADRYLSDLPDYVVSVGRMGRYRYVDIDDIIMDALVFGKSL